MILCTKSYSLDKLINHSAGYRQIFSDQCGSVWIKLLTPLFAQNPNVTKLQNRPGYRLRVGDWRVIYDVQEGEMIILVLKVGSRGDVYR
jgi:mRNA-degrading endonuclease RelE of RelBE toxin-antitoxin system